MGGQIDDVVKDLVSVNNTIGAIAVIDSNGRVVYATQNWKVDGAELINSWPIRPHQSLFKASGTRLCRQLKKG